MCVRTPDGKMVVFPRDRELQPLEPMIAPAKVPGEDKKDWEKRFFAWQRTIPMGTSTRCSCNTMDEPQGQVYDPETGKVSVRKDTK